MPLPIPEFVLHDWAVAFKFDLKIFIFLIETANMLTPTTDVSEMWRWLNENRNYEKLSLLTPFTSILYKYSVIFFDRKFTFILW